MKRLTVFGIITLALVSTLLIAAGSGGNGGSGFDPNSHGNVPFAIVRDESGDTNVRYGELVMYSGDDRYLLVSDPNCDSAVDKTKSITLTLCPGPGGIYRIWRISGKTNGDDSILCWDTANTQGEIQVSFSLKRGEGALLLTEKMSNSSSDTVLSTSDLATYDVNGRKIVIDQTCRIHICYNDSLNGKSVVYYAKSEDGGSSWQKVLLDSNACNPSIALDKFGVPFVVYAKKSANGYNNVSLWNEGVYDSTWDFPYTSSNPPIAVSDVNGKGNFFYTGSRIMSQSFDANGFPYSGPILQEVSQPFGAYVNNISCTYTDSGRIVFAGRCIDKDKLNKLYYEVGGQGYPRGFVNGTHGNPSISRQGDEIWMVYSTSGSKNIRCKKALAKNKYRIPADDTFSTIATTPGESACFVQIAEAAPLVVWEDHSGSAIKIYYSYMKNDGTWTTPARVTQTSSSIKERYPHVAVDAESHLVRMIWTVIDGSNSIGRGDKAPTEDSVRVIRPNGGEKFTLHSVGGAWWWQGENHDTDKPERTKIEINYHYPNGNWIKVDSSFYQSDSTLPMLYWGHHSVKLPLDTITDSARVRVTAYYNGSAKTDISDSNFRITTLSIETASNQVVGNGYFSYTPGGSHKIVDWQALSSSGFNSVSLEVSKDQGNSFTSIGDSSSYDSTLTDTMFQSGDTIYCYEYTGNTYWTTPTTPVSNACLRLMVTDTLGDTAYSELFYPFAVAPPGGNRYATSYNQRLIAEGKASGQIGIAYRGQATDTSDPVIYYINSDEGLDFDEPDSVGEGILPTHEQGCVAWLSESRNQVRYSNWNQNNQTFNNSTNVLIGVAGAVVTKYTPPALKIVNDTVHVISIRKAVVQSGGFYTTYSYLIHLRFLKDYPGSPLRDSFSLGTTSGYDTTGLDAIHLDIQGSNLLASIRYKDTCYYLKTPYSSPSITGLHKVGKGICPFVSGSEGNVVYSYIANDSTSLIRLWNYRDDTSWVQRDTIPLDTSLNYETMTSSKGLMFGAQHEDTSLAELYVYNPISDGLYFLQDYTGYYPHPYIDNESSEFSMVDVYSEVVDSETINLHTQREDMSVIIPELYLESGDKRSPFTIYRDTCVHYSSVDIDSGTDSLRYRFPYLDDSKDYSVIVEFYTEEENSDTLEITLGSEVDTIQIPGNDYSWFEQNVPSNTDTMNLKIKKLSREGFVPVSRVMVRERSDSGLFMMKGKPIAGPEKIVFCLFQPNPNPFSDAATIQYSLPYETNVSLKVYDISGRLVNTLVQGKVQAGVHTIRWEGKDNINRKCSSGVYFVRFIAADYRASKKMVMLK